MYNTTANETTNNNTCNRTLETLQQEATQLPALVYMIVIGVAGLWGNSLICYVFCFKFARTPLGIFIMTMAGFDLLAVVVVVPSNVYELMYSTSLLLCRSRMYIVFFTMYGSSLSLIGIAVTRYRKICRPFRKQVTIPHARKAVLAFIPIALGYSLPNLFLYDTQFNHTCVITCGIQTYPPWTIINTVFHHVCFFFTCACIVTLYLLIMVKVRRLEHFRSVRFVHKSPSVNCSADQTRTQRNNDESSTSDTFQLELPPRKDYSNENGAPEDKSQDLALNVSRILRVTDTEKITKRRSLMQELKARLKLRTEVDETKQSEVGKKPKDVYFELEIVNSSDEEQDCDADNDGCGADHKGCVVDHEYSDVDRKDCGVDDSEGPIKESRKQNKTSGSGSSKPMKKRRVVLVDTQNTQDKLDNNNSSDTQHFPHTSCSHVADTQEDPGIYSLAQQIAATPDENTHPPNNGINTSIPESGQTEMENENVDGNVYESVDGPSLDKTFDETSTNIDINNNTRPKPKCGVGRTTCMLFIISFVYIFSILPFIVSILLESVSAVTMATMHHVGYALFYHLQRSYLIGPAVNPIIYIHFDARVRRECLKICRFPFCRKK